MKVWLLLLLLLAIACAAAFGWQQIAADPGYVLVRYGVTSIETTLVFALAFLLLAWGALSLLGRLLRTPLAAWSRRRRRRGRERISRGLVALAEGRYASALRELERASHLSGLQAPALLGAARAAQARGDRERAGALLAQAPPAAALVLRARFELEGGRPAAALALLKQEMEKSTLPPAAWHLLVESALQCGEPVIALEALPKLARAQALTLADFSALEARAQAAALAAAPDRERLGQLWSKLPRGQRRPAEAVAAYARRAAELGQVLAAMSEIEAALRRQWSEALISGYSELGPAEAEARLRHAEGWITDQPNSPGLALTLGRLCIQCKLWGKAREYLERGLAIEPSAALWEALGDCSRGREERDLAALCYRNALRAARGEPTDALPGLAGVPAALSTRASVIETRSPHGVPQLPGIAHE
jgi:HemY protein